MSDKEKGCLSVVEPEMEVKRGKLSGIRLGKYVVRCVQWKEDGEVFKSKSRIVEIGENIICAVLVDKVWHSVSFSRTGEAIYESEYYYEWIEDEIKE